jgi:hypothetical protein
MSSKITVSAFKKGEECLVNSLSVEEKESINLFIRNINGFENSNLDDKHPYATFDNLDDENIGKKFIINELENIEILLEKSKKLNKKSTKKSTKKIDDQINETANLKMDSSDEIKNENNINDISISVNTEIVNDTILKEPDTEISKIVTTPVLEKKKKGKKSTSKEEISIPSVEQLKVEQPKVEQPIVEETKDEQLTVEQPIVEQPESDKSEPTVPKKKKATKKAISDDGKEKSETVPKKKSTKKIDTTESTDTTEVTVKKVIIRNCSLCKTPGHDKRTCPNKAI